VTNNKVVDNLGAPEPLDPLNVGAVPDEIRQSAVRDNLAQKAGARSINYETLPLYVESFLLAVLVDQFKQDDTFTYDPVDELKTKIIFTNTWQRSLPESRDLRPRVIVAFQQAGAENMVLRDSFLASLPSNPTVTDQKGTMETLSFRIAVMHHNRSLCLFLASQIRALIAATTEILRGVFQLQRVTPPSLQGPGSIEEMEDVYGCFIDLQILAVPRWEVRKDPEYIRRIIIETIGTAQGLIAGAITQSTEVVTTSRPGG
jgi:hypothetical protein